MYVKSLPWHYAGFKSLVDYITKERNEDHELRLDIHHNIRPTEDPQHLAIQFKENDLAFRKVRKNGVVLYHEVLSFSANDREKLTPAIIEDLVREYLDLRAPGALAFGSTHLRESHIHVHLCISGNNYRSSKATRLEKEDFINIRKSLEEYQKIKYPELTHSIAYGERTQQRKNKRELLERITSTSQWLLEQASDTEDLRKGLEMEGLELYYYKGEPVGVKVDNQKFRFRRLGLDISHLAVEEPGRDHIAITQLQESELPELQHEILKLRERNRFQEERSDRHQQRIDLINSHMVSETTDPDRANWYRHLAKEEGREEEYKKLGPIALNNANKHQAREEYFRKLRLDIAKRSEPGALRDWYQKHHPDHSVGYTPRFEQPTEAKMPTEAYHGLWRIPAPIFETVREAYQDADSLHRLEERLATAGMQTYHVAGQVTGVVFEGFRTSLSFLGFSLASFRHKLNERQIEEYKHRQEERSKQKWESLTPEEKRRRIAIAQAIAWQQREQEEASRARA